MKTTLFDIPIRICATYNRCSTFSPTSERHQIELWTLSVGVAKISHRGGSFQMHHQAALPHSKHRLSWAALEVALHPEPQWCRGKRILVYNDSLKLSIRPFFSFFFFVCSGNMDKNALLECCRKGIHMYVHMYQCFLPLYYLSKLSTRLH